MDLYILRLQEGKYYIGTTENVEIKFAQHVSGQGPKWTQKYSPIEIVKTFRNVKGNMENKMVQDYMTQYGINNVRSDSYNRVKLPPAQLNELIAKLKMEQNKCHYCAEVDHITDDCGVVCIRCGRANHQAQNCKYKYDINGNSLIACNRCGKAGHTDENCYALVTVNGFLLPSSANTTPDSSPRFEEEMSMETPLQFKNFNSKRKCLKCSCIML